MNKLIFTLLSILVSYSFLTAQQDTTKYWTKSGNVGLNFSEVGLSNWSGGGKSNIAFAAMFNYTANYKKNNIEWNNYLELGYGMTKLDMPELRKSDDRLVFVTKFGYKAAEDLNYSALVDFRTQFDKGLNFDKKDSLGNYIKISNLFSPAYLNIGFGMNYQPYDFFQLTFSPLSNRLIIVADKDLSNQSAFGVDSGKNIKSELGIGLNLLFKKEIFTNVTLQSRINLFSAFHKLAYVVISSETLMTMKVNNWLSVNFNFDVFYDDKIVVIRDDGTSGPATQMRNVLAIGILYKL